MIIPSVPSAPMKSFVVSNPAEDFRERLRVLTTSPDGSTTVCVIVRSQYLGEMWDVVRRHTYHIEKPFTLGSTVSYSVRLNRFSVRSPHIAHCAYILPEHPLLIIPPIVAPGAGSIYKREYRFLTMLCLQSLTYREE